MPGCLNNCFLFWETHTLENVDADTQIKIEKELKKARSGEDYDASILSKLVNKRCLGNYFKKGQNLKDKCRYYWELPEDLSLKDRIEILNTRKNKKWKIATLILGIINVILLSVSVYIGAKKSQLADVKSQNVSLASEVTDLQHQLNTKNSSINKLQDDMAILRSNNGQMNKQIIILEKQISDCKKELLNRTEKNKK
jgi:hypothetical protein